MKTILSVLLAFMMSNASAQADSVSAPFQKFPDNIPLKLLLTDSSTVFTTETIDLKRPFLVLIFSPDCTHCQQETEDIIANINLFRDVNIIMATPLPFHAMKEFYTKYKLDRFNNIIMGRDYQYMLPTYYSIRYLPFHAFYGKKKKLIGVSYEGMTTAQMIERFNN